MGSITYDFLAESIFLHKNSINSRFKNESIDRVERELIDYREHCLKNSDALIKEISENASSLSVLSSTTDTSLNLLKQTALYFDQYVISDPLFRFTNLASDTEKVMSKHFGFNSRGINLNSLTDAARYLKEITPMVAGNFVKIFPLSFHFEPPKELPLNLPADYYNDILPKDLLRFFHERSLISPLEKDTKGGWIILNNQELNPCRAISVEFKGAGCRNGMIYFLQEMEILSVDEASGKVLYKQSLPDYPPSEDSFKAWIKQSVNSAAKKYFDNVSGEIYIASKLNSTYICDNSFSNELISTSFDCTDSIQSFTANQMLNIELPFLDQIDTQKLMAIREHDADIFTNFRLELEKQFRELRNISDEKQLKLKAENIFHELNEVQGQRIRQKMDYLKKQMFLNSVMAVGGLAAFVPSGGISLLSTTLALAKGYKDYNDYLEKVKENPAYFLWSSKK